MRQFRHNLTALRAFHALVQAGGIAGAAATLNVTPGAIRHQLRQLEEDVGHPLIVRSKRTLTMTAAGIRLYETVGRALAEIATACRSLGANDVAGELRVSCAPAFAALRLMSVINTFAERYPMMAVRLFPHDWADETMDVIISYGEHPVSGARMAILRDESYFPVCSPALAYKHDIARPEDLAALVGLHADAGTDWARVLGAAPDAVVRFRQEMFFPNAHLSLQAAREGCGVAVGTTILCADDLKRGNFVRLLDLEVPAPNPYFVIQPKGSRSLAAEAFISILVEQVAGL
jgi:LysR family glycine cleavage system transcriptional activator